LLGLLLYFGLTPPAAVLTLPLFLALAVGTALGAGLWLSALHVRYRDVAYVVPFLTQVWFFLTPVVYPGSLVPERWRPLYGLNPMVGVVEGFRWALLGTGAPPGRLTLVSAAVALVLLVGGLCYFRRVEDEFADLI
jgi:lipopolysaccharide transport system permease protein